jgi:hypothetical protein
MSSRFAFVVRHRIFFIATVFALVAFCAAQSTASAQSTPTPTPSPPAREALSDAWWTGPLLAPSAATLPHGHVLIEPYVYDVMQYGSYGSNGRLTQAPHANGFGSLTYIIYGLADRLSVGMIPVFAFNTASNAPSSSGVRFGDLALQAQYRIAQYRAGSWIPTTSINVQETFPTGKYDQLGDRPANGTGSGTYTTTLSLYTQTYFWLRGRILRMRVNASQSYSSSTNVNGVSVYGTGAGFHGSAKPGNSFTLDLAQEYSITRNWVFALDEVYHHSGNTQVVDANGSVTNSGDSTAFQLAPAMEYNWTSNVGVIVGLRLIPAGRNTSASVTPAIAINIVH